MSAEQAKQAAQADALAFRRTGDPGNPGELLLCLRMEQSAELAQSAHNILDDALNRFCPGVSRADLREEEADRTIMWNIKARATWPEGFANKLYLASRAGHSAACGLGSNQRHRKRVTSLALAMLLICENSQNPQCGPLFQCHPLLLSLARVCMAVYTAPQEATAAPAAPLVVPAAAAQPAPVVARPEPEPQTPAERLQHLARSLGADEEVLNDPYLFVQQDTGHILCAACNKHLTAAHTQSKKHTGYLSNIDATLQWIRIERPDWLCLQILEMNGPFNRVPTRTAREAPPKSCVPQGPSGEFRPPSPRNPSDADFSMPTDGEIFDFLMALSGRKWRCWNARWLSTEEPQPIRFPGRPSTSQPDPSGGQRTGRVVRIGAAPQAAQEEQEVEEV